MPEALRLRGPLDRLALQQTIDTIAARHESLRTRFVEIDGEPVQLIAPVLHIDLPLEDLSTLDEAAQQEQVAAALRQEWEQPFDLAHGPLLRLKLVRLNEQDHILLRTFHDIISDGWSQGVFNREIGVLYEAFREGRDNPLEPLAVQYADFRVAGSTQSRSIVGCSTGSSSWLASPSGWSCRQTTPYLLQWQQLYDATYRQADSAAGDSNLVGWNSSYTGQPIAPEQMRLWVVQTVARLRALRPRECSRSGVGPAWC
jgi:hypothetical protein